MGMYGNVSNLSVSLQSCIKLEQSGVGDTDGEIVGFFAGAVVGCLVGDFVITSQQLLHVKLQFSA